MAEPESTYTSSDEPQTAENTIARYTNILENEGLRALQEELHKDSNHWKTSVSLNVAVLGASGAGKSSFVNALFGRTPESEGAARVGVTETTTEMQSYCDPSRPGFVVSDTPGLGTKKFPRDKLFEGYKLQTFDFYLICTRTRFTQDDLQLITEVTNKDKKFYLIRTAIDEDIRREKLSYPGTFDKERVKTNIRDHCTKILRKHNFAAPIYLVNSYKISDHDFDSLVNRLFSDLSSLKEEALALSLHTLSKEVLFQKNNFLHERAFKKAMEIACVFDDRTKQTQLFDEEINFYVEQFQLNPKAIKDNKDILKFENLDDNVSGSIPVHTNYRSEDIPEMNWIKTLLLGLKSYFVKGAHSTKTYDYCLAAFQTNIAIMYEKALAIYDKNVFKGITRNAMSE